MPGTHLEAPLFIKEISESAVDIARTPFFFNDGGAPTFLDAPPAGATALTPAATRASAAICTSAVVVPFFSMYLMPLLSRNSTS